jgi:flagellar protein FlaG
VAQETLSSAILIIAAIIATVALVNAIYPSLFTATGSVGTASGLASDRVETDLRISMATSPNSSALFVWAKNVGSTAVAASKIAYTDVYYGDEGSMMKASSNQSAGFRWGYELDDMDGDGNWDGGETLKITIIDAEGPRFTAGSHKVKLVLHNAASFEDTITI